MKNDPLLLKTLVLALICVVPITCVACANDTTIKSGLSSAKLANASNQSIEPHLKYHIQAKLNIEDMTITGKQIVTYRNPSKDKLKNIVFHLFADAHRTKKTQSDLFVAMNKDIAKKNPARKAQDFVGQIDILGIKNIATGRQLTFVNENQVLQVELEKELAKDEWVTMEFIFKTKIPFGAQRLSYQKNAIAGAHWFPVMSVYNEQTHQWNKTPYSTTFETDYYETADYQVEINIPEKINIVMPGQISEKVTSAGRKIVRTQAKNTREFVFFANEKFHTERKTKHGLTIEYAYINDPHHPAKLALIRQYIDLAFEVIEFLNDKVGPYPYPEFRIVESPIDGLAIEFSRLIQMGLLDDTKIKTLTQIGVKNHSAFVHEIAHQWFHSIIGNNSETESVLDEGFADFFMCYFYEKKGSKLQGFDGMRLGILSEDKAINSTNHKAKNMWNLLFYQGGRLVIYDLYRTVGEKKFVDFMKAYFHRYAYRNATVEGLLTMIEKQFGKPIRVRVDRNLNQPNFELKSEYRLTDAEQKELLQRFQPGKLN